MKPSPLQELSKIEARIRAASEVSLFLDFDGTLAPLELDPAAVLLPAPVRETLARLARTPLVTTIISGRAVSDLKPRVGVEGLIYAGNHGLEISGPRMRFIEPEAAARRPELEQLTGRLLQKLQNVPGVLVEFKALSTTVHYRGAPVERVSAIKNTIRAVTAPVSASFMVRSSKMALEILPRTAWNKGAAALWINECLDHGNNLSIFLGDDATDEDAFRALPDGITVRVSDAGEVRATSARYRLPDPLAVHEFLTWLEEHANNGTLEY